MKDQNVLIPNWYCKLEDYTLLIKSYCKDLCISRYEFWNNNFLLIAILIFLVDFDVSVHWTSWEAVVFNDEGLMKHQCCFTTSVNKKKIFHLYCLFPGHVLEPQVLPDPSWGLPIPRAPSVDRRRGWGAWPSLGQCPGEELHQERVAHSRLVSLSALRLFTNENDVCIEG